MEEYTREQAIQDFQTVWRYMAETGYIDKFSVIKTLFKLKKISRSRYIYHNPLCAKYSDDFDVGCTNCPWPGTGAERCKRQFFSPLRRWERLVCYGVFLRKFRIKRAAKKVYKLSLTFK